MATLSSHEFSDGRLIAPERVPEGFLWVDSQGAWSTGKFLLSFVWTSLWCGISFPGFTRMLLNFLADPHVGRFLMLLFVGMFAAAGVGMIWNGLRWLKIVSAFQPGEVLLPSYPLRMGETFRLRFRRALRRGHTHRPGKIIAKWLCYEWVQYRQGTDIETKVHMLWEQDLPTMTVSTGTRVATYETKLTVLPEGPPSFDAEHNQVRWEILISVDVPGIPQDTAHFRFAVVPEAV
ncbi:MAG: hypothetical protein AAFX01_03885 [Cyanobacteria bacterium J06638_28]